MEDIKKHFSFFHVKKESINKDKIDWGKFESEVLAKAAISRDSGIVTALTLNGNPHTFYLKGNKRLLGKINRRVSLTPESLFCDVNNNWEQDRFSEFGYIRVNSLTSQLGNNSNSNAVQYVTNVLASECC